MSGLCIHQSDINDTDDPAAELAVLWPLLSDPVRAAVLTLARATAGLPAQAEELPLMLEMPHVTGLLGVSRSTVDRMDAEQKIPAPVRAGRAKKWERDDFLAWLRHRRPDGSTFSRAEWARLSMK